MDFSHCIPELYNKVVYKGGWEREAISIGTQLDGVAQHEYNSENTILPENLDANVWEIRNGVPMLKSA